MIKMDNNNSQPSREQLRKKIGELKKPIQSMLKQYKYQQEISHADNMKKLCVCLENVMNVDSIDDFAKFLSNQQHLPIQVNFKALRYQYLHVMFEDWLNNKQQQTTHQIERTFTNKHRNILFKRIFLQQKQAINDYFQTLSPKRKLKGIDLFQLITQILSPFYLYQFNSDAQTFFEKVNSFNHFTQMIENFVTNARRSYVKDKSDSNDQSYIRCHQFEFLIQFWENINPQLTIQQAPRKNTVQIGIQTNSSNANNTQTQTQKQNQKNYLCILNNTLHQINILIAKQNDKQLLTSLDIVFDALRSQKLFAATYYAQKHNQNKLLHNMNDRKRRSPNKLLSSQFLQCERLATFNRLNSPKKTKLPRKILINTLVDDKAGMQSPKQYQEDQVKRIYRFLCSKDSLNCLTLNQLQIFLFNLGLTQAHEYYLVQNLLNYGLVDDKDQISLKQFKNILKLLMNQNKQFTLFSLKQYINSFIQLDSMTKTAYFKVISPKNQNVNIFSDYANLSGHKSHEPERAGQISSRTTHLLDSEGSNF